LYDILLFEGTFDNMLSRLEVIFKRLAHFNLKLKPSKCHFLKQEVLYLGHIVSADGVKTDPDKTIIVQQWSIPRTESDPRSFLGLSGFYRKFVPGYAKIASTLHRLLNKPGRKKKVCIPDTRTFVEKWTPECTDAFNLLKSKLVTSPILGYPDFTLPFQLRWMLHLLA
jgi:hypothetical protein